MVELNRAAIQEEVQGQRNKVTKYTLPPSHPCPNRPNPHGSQRDMACCSVSTTDRSVSQTGVGKGSDLEREREVHGVVKSSRLGP